MRLSQLLAAKTGIVLVSVLCALGDDCFSGENIQLKKCYTDTGLGAPLMSSYVSSTLQRLDNIDEYCLQPEAFRKAYHCSAQVMLNCAKDNLNTFAYSLYMLTPEQAEQIADLACLQVHNWNTTCLEKHAKAYTECITSNMKTKVNSDRSRMICENIEGAKNCVLSHLSPCGCASVKLIFDVMSGPAYPEVCQPIQFPSVNCDSKNPFNFNKNGVSFTTGRRLFIPFLSLVHLMLVM